MAFATAGTSGAEGRPARGFTYRHALPIGAGTVALSEPVAFHGFAASGPRPIPDRRDFDRRHFDRSHLDHRDFDRRDFDRRHFDCRAFECREPEGDPYAAGRMPPMSVRPAARRHPPTTATPATRAPEVGPIPDPPRAYPVESAFLQADRIALSLRGALERTTIPLARTGTALVAANAWCDFGFARLDDYARERLGRSGRWVRDLAALGERLSSLPSLAVAITGEDGGRPIGRVAAMLIAKIASPSSLDGWIARARASSIRALRDAVRAARAAPPDATAAAAAAPTESPAAAPDDDDDAADRLLVRMMVPSPILAAFDEALDLFRAVEGGEATIASFVEALVAEAAARGADDAAAIGGTGAGATPAMGDADMRVLRAGPAVAALERALAASTGNWRHLPEHAESSWALSLAGVTLARFRALADEAGRGDAADLDRQLRALIELENELETRLGGLLADLADRRAWPRLRFAGVGHYGEERLGLSRTAAEDRARLARDLRLYPRLREAYTTGLLSRETAALVARLLRDAPSDPAREAAWVERAAESTVKRMRDEARALGRYRVLGPRESGVEAAAGAPAGASADAPDAAAAAGASAADAADAAADAAGADAADADDAAPSTPGAPLDDAAWHASLRREPELARRRVHLFGRLAFTSPDVFQALPHESDTFLRLRLPHDLGRLFLAVVDAERRRLAAAADELPWDAEAGAPPWDADPNAPGDPDSEPPTDSDRPTGSDAPSWLAARMFSIRCRRLPAWVGLLSLLEDFVDTWDDEHGMPRRPGDEIYIRDGWRCSAPGCTSRRNLEDHHLRYRSRGGDDGHANRICLCRFHHQRGEHGGLASCRGKAPVAVVWRLGHKDVTPTWYRNERRIAAG